MNLRRLTVTCVSLAVVALILRSWFHTAEPDPAFQQAAAERAAQAAMSRVPEDHRRSSEFTYLTIPEWYLVWSPQEYAQFLKDGKPPSDFPFLGHLQQFWQGYGVVCEETDKYPFNTDYHEMIWVIGTSTTVEYGLKWTYEKMVGRVSEATVRGGTTTEEDRICTQAAGEYIDLLFVEPWFKFDFMKPLRAVWSAEWWGTNPIRSWERKYLLTSEYLVKGAYGWVIRQASESVFPDEKPVTAVVLDRYPEAARQQLTEVKVIKEHADGSVLAFVPRYQPFTAQALLLAKTGSNFVEIAGNKDGILVSSVVSVYFLDPLGPRTVLTEPILTRPGEQRIVVSVPVGQLAELLRRYDSDRRRVRLEHVYDY